MKPDMKHLVKINDKAWDLLNSAGYLESAMDLIKRSLNRVNDPQISEILDVISGIRLSQCEMGDNLKKEFENATKG